MELSYAFRLSRDTSQDAHGELCDWGLSQFSYLRLNVKDFTRLGAAYEPEGFYMMIWGLKGGVGGVNFAWKRSFEYLRIA